MYEYNRELLIRRLEMMADKKEYQAEVRKYQPGNLSLYFQEESDFYRAVIQALNEPVKQD